jgi:uncharacterized membrane protein
VKRKKISKFILGGVLGGIILMAVLILLEANGLFLKEEHVEIDHSLIAENGYKVGTIHVEDSYELPHKFSANLRGGMTEIYKTKDEFLSEWMPAELPFYALGISWNEKAIEGVDSRILVRTRKIDGANSEWLEVEEDADNMGESEKKYSFVRTAWSTHIQYKLELESKDSNLSPVISDLEFTYIDGSKNEEAERASDDLVAGLNITGRGLNVISRKQWGAAEDLRVFRGLGKPDQVEVDEEIKEKYANEIVLRKEVKRNENDEILIWPVQYPEQDIEVIFVHHTASQEDAMEDSYAAMRAIYYYHAAIRGWGDIGYNYLIDEDGNIFEGRYGGDEVVGAHVANYNVGSIGVAIIGNYQENEVRSGAVKGLIDLLTHLSEKHDLDPTAIATMRGENLHVISGHRDATHTTCPGQYIYEKLSSIRQLVKSELQAKGVLKSDSTTEIIGTKNGVDFEDPYNRNITVVGPEEQKTISVKLRNTGTVSWGRNATLIYKNGSENIAGFSETVARMNEAQVSPGGTGTFTIPMQGNFSSGLKNYYLYLKTGTLISERKLNFPVYIEPAYLDFELIQIDKSPKLNLKKNESTGATFTVENMGNVTWRKENISLKSSALNSLFVTGHMVTRSEVKPGEKAVFEVAFKAGVTAGEFEEKIKLILIDGIGNRVQSRTSQTFNLKVKGIVKKTNTIEITNTSEDLTLKPGEQKRMWIEVQNNGSSTWKRVGKDRVYIATLKSPLIKAGHVVMDKGTVKPGEKTRIYFRLTAPEKSGNHFINFIFRHRDARLSEKPVRFEFSVTGRVAPTIPQVSTNQSSTSTLSPKTKINTATSSSGVGEKIRVALSFRGAPSITADSNVRIFDGEGNHLNDGISIRAGEKIKILRSDDAYIVKFADKKVLTKSHIRIGSQNGILKIDNFENRPAWNQELNDNEYRGVLEVRWVGDPSHPLGGELKVINELPLEHYLYGIGEVSNGDPTEKIKTIITLARTYATYYMDRRGTSEAKFPGKPYDLDDDPNVSQRYLGYGVEKRAPNVVKAVNATTGNVVTYEDKVVKTPYFNSTDGTATRGAEEVWGWTHTPYLVSVPDTLCEASMFSGHGVGLSGCGATAAATRGYKFQDIIKFYYKGVEIEKKY